LLGDGVAFGETDGDLLGVGVFGFGVGEDFFVLGVGDGLDVFVAPTASFIIPGKTVPRASKKTLLDICPMIEMVSKQS
jgi:hypothetical protein